MVYPDVGMLFVNTKKWSIDTCYNMDEHFKPYAKGVKPRSPALQADSLLSEPPGKPKNTGVGGLSLLQQIFLAQKSNRGLPYCRWILYQLSYQVIIIHTFKKTHTFVLLKKISAISTTSITFCNFIACLLRGVRCIEYLARSISNLVFFKLVKLMVTVT